MLKNINIVYIAFCALCCCTCSLSAYKSKAAGKPNVVFILTDDQQYQTLELLQRGLIKAPVMDSLSRSGISFSNAHIMGAMNGAVCAPSRAMILSGRSLFNIDPTGSVIDTAYTTLPQWMKENGYHTYHIGKWHNDKASFQRSFSNGSRIFFGGMSDHFKVPLREFDATGKYSESRIYTLNKHSTEIYADAAVDFLNEYAEDAPFFLHLAFQAPHDPKQVHEKYREMYNAEEVELPSNFLLQHPFDNGEINIRDEWLASTPRKPEVIKKHNSVYHAMITHLDDNINKVLKALKEKGVSDNTIIILTSDNGLALGQHGLMGKQNVYEHSMKVPLVMAGPGIQRGASRNGLCYLIDIYPTLCDLVGLKTPETVQGKSLTSAMKDEDTALRNQLVLAYKHFQRGIIRDGWKLIEYQVSGEKHTQLFDLRKDPFEITNLATEPEHQQTIRLLREKMQKEMKAGNDPVILHESDWGVSPIPAWLELMESRNPEALKQLIKVAEEERKQYGDSTELKSIKFEK